ncbi:hypothetical protein CQ018_15220 [Arthrobacter sp. MYb227]|uniref:hypothetical protein n=1 Tax=Arthrobacter sp. MYb227 TaxID=1848601 RepID=UPI000CFDD517|nr:hypothetical protein [Arthrobacter sp. MYb227]PQZ89513.1 hypothetical protein CQ018_15220 [Arthrobacter sp. MYb227]
MAAVSEGLGPWGIANRRRFICAAAFLVVSGLIGTIATIIRWFPCGDTSDRGQCTGFDSLSIMPFGWYFVMWGIADLLLAAGVSLILLRHVHGVFITVLALGIVSTAALTLLFGLGIESLRLSAMWFLTMNWWLFTPLIAVTIIIMMGRTWDYAGNNWALLPVVALVLGAGLCEYFFLQLVFQSVDTPRASDGLRYMFLVVIGLLMCGFLVQKRLSEAALERRNAS